MLTLTGPEMEPRVDRSITVRRCREAANRARPWRASRLRGSVLAAALLLSPFSLGAPGRGLRTHNQVFAQSAGDSRSTWLVREGDNRLALRAPDGFMRQNASDTNEALGAFVFPGQRVVLVVRELPETLAQGAALNDDQRPWIREADLFDAADQRVSFRVFGFESPGLLGRGQLEDERVVRLAAAVPLRQSTVVVYAFGPEANERAVRRAMDDTLASVRGDTHWKTRAQRALDAVSVWGFLLALVCTLLYAIGHGARWRKSPDARASWVKVGLRAALGLGYLATSLYWLRASDWLGVGMGVLLLLLGAQQTIGAVGLARDRSAGASKDKPERAAK